MPPLHRSARAHLLLLPLLATYLGACTAERQVNLAATPDHGKIAGVITRNGRHFQFDPVGVVIANDTIYAQSKEGQVLIPADSVQSVVLKEFSTTKTVELVLVTGAVLVLFVMLANKTAGSSVTAY